jgi:hypothetical protein
MRTPLKLLTTLAIMAFGLGPVAAVPSLPKYATARLPIQPGVYHKVEADALPRIYHYDTIPGASYYQLSWQNDPHGEDLVQGFVYFVALPCAPVVLRLTVMLEDVRGPHDIEAYADFIQPSQHGTAFSVLNLRARNPQAMDDAGFFWLPTMPDSEHAAAVGCDLLKDYKIGKPLENYRRADS